MQLNVFMKKMGVTLMLVIVWPSGFLDRSSVCAGFRGIACRHSDGFFRRGHSKC